MKALVNIFCLIVTLLALHVSSNGANQTQSHTQVKSDIATDTDLYDKEVFKTLNEIELELINEKLALLKERLAYLEAENSNVESPVEEECQDESSHMSILSKDIDKKVNLTKK